MCLPNGRGIQVSNPDNINMMMVNMGTPNLNTEIKLVNDQKFYGPIV